MDEGFQFELWSDLDKELALYYGAAANRLQPAASRKTYLLDGDGTLILEYPSVGDLGTHPSQVLEDCEQLFGG